MSVSLIKDDFLIIYAYERRRLNAAQRERVRNLIDKAICYVWGWTDAGGMYPGESSSDAAWKFGQWYGVQVAEMEAGARPGHGAIQDEWLRWCALQGAPIVSRTLTSSLAVALASVLGAAQRNAKVGRLLAGKIFAGTATNICDDNGNTYPHNADVRRAHLRVVGSNGVVVHHWLIADLIREIADGTFVVDYREHDA